MNKKLLHCALFSLIFIFPLGCAKQENRVDRFYGTSYELAKVSQIDNPKAGMQDGPSLGLDGDVGELVVERYEKGFAKEAPKTDNFSVVFEGMKTK